MIVEVNRVIRVACYIRVSTQEQKLHGISLDAQRDKLQEYANKHHLKIVEWYEDEGISGRKLIKNRPALQRMLHDAQKGKFDRIIFIKLDRFFRSVAEYHECMKIIEPVLWTATEEKYDLTTANGRAFVNMKLTIAELEADQTGERINLVNEYKVKTGQALTGSQCQGYGYTVKVIDGVKRVVKDPDTAHIVDDFINYFLSHQNKRQAHQYIKNKYHVVVSYNTLSNMLKNTKLYGSYRGNDNYIDEPYVNKATFDKIQDILKRNIKVTSAHKTFLFTGLLKCPVCNRIMAGNCDAGFKHYNRPSGKSYTYYREYYRYQCNNARRDGNCTFKPRINEPALEEWLLDNLEQYVNSTIIEASVMDNRADIDNETVNKKITELKTEMTKVKRMYRKGDITEAEYDNDMEELKTELKTLENQLEPLTERDLTIYEELIKSDWRSLYNALNKENKRAFWRKYINRIEFSEKGNPLQPIFF